MSKVIVNDLKPAIEYLTEVLDKTESLLIQIKLSKIISHLSNYFGGSAPVSLIVESYKRRYGDSARLESKLEKLLKTEIEYDGPTLTQDDINQMPEITADDLIKIDFLIKDW